ncbi:glycerophosphodiester phosphodiesterase, partial [Halorubrum persicum]|uniref:glycerophosphodiester phosphodiesterase n=1 Tax=Halorubrum persicum TaxID=1383844 RepID=UPI001181A300
TASPASCAASTTSASPNRDASKHGAPRIASIGGCTAAASCRRANDLLVSSFHEAALAATREVSEYPVAPLFSESIGDALAIARRHDAAAVHPPIDAIRGAPCFDASRFGDADVVDAAHDAGLAVNVWTVETWYQTDRLAAAGVDGVIADYSTVRER